jgi:hypothetical protein
MEESRNEKRAHQHVYPRRCETRHFKHCSHQRNYRHVFGKMRVRSDRAAKGLRPCDARGGWQRDSARGQVQEFPTCKFHRSLLSTSVQRVLDAVVPPNGKPGRYRSDDKLLAFLNSL